MKKRFGRRAKRAISMLMGAALIVETINCSAMVVNAADAWFYIKTDGEKTDQEHPSAGLFSGGIEVKDAIDDEVAAAITRKSDTWIQDGESGTGVEEKIDISKTPDATDYADDAKLKAAIDNGSCIFPDLGAAYVDWYVVKLEGDGKLHVDGVLRAKPAPEPTPTVAPAVTPEPTVTPAAEPTPGTVSSPTVTESTTPENNNVEEVNNEQEIVDITDEKVPLNSSVENGVSKNEEQPVVIIEDEEPPFSSGIGHCWIHWLILILTVVYTIYELVRTSKRNKIIRELEADRQSAQV